MAFVIECTETAIWHHMLSTMQIASFSQQAELLQHIHVRLQNTVQHTVQFGVAGGNAQQARNATM